MGKLEIFRPLELYADGKQPLKNVLPKCNIFLLILCILKDSDDDQTIRSSSASTSPSTSDTKPKDVVSEPAPYTLISSLTNTQQQHQLNKSSALVHPHYTPLTPTPPQPPTVSSEKSSASSSNWNPITKIFNKNVRMQLILKPKKIYTVDSLCNLNLKGKISFE